ncbi:hypothetical protein AXA44_36370 [Rhodococcus sp. SC4]|nr:hypothetical protein AXA44_36370 [Rhodococcus sp. SC4]
MRGTNQRGGVQVMAACMAGTVARCELLVRLLFDRQGVHVGTRQHRGRLGWVSAVARTTAVTEGSDSPIEI